jgi:hypothetical protein
LPLGVTSKRRVAQVLAGPARRQHEMRRVGPFDHDAALDSSARPEGRRSQILGLKARRVGVGDVLGQELLARLMPMHARLQHLDEGEVGDGHLGPGEPGKICSAYG